MPKFKYWTDSFPLLILMILSGFAGWGLGMEMSAPDHFSIETIIAGLLGLGGGTFAWFAARAQIAAQQRMRNEDVARTEDLENTRYYLFGAEIGELCHLFANSTLEMMTSSPITAKEIASMQDALIATEIPESPLAAPDNIASAAINLKLARSRLLIYLKSMLKEAEEIPLDHGMSILPQDSPNSIHQSLRDFATMGIFLKDECEIYLKKRK